jgi:hypothetical protein
MTHPNALRTPHATSSHHAGIHLVYSRSWKGEDRRQPMTGPVEAPRAERTARRTRKAHVADTLSLAAAAMAAPFVWIAHALLQTLHVL